MIRVGLIGGRGYVGEELLRLLEPMPEYEVVFAGSRSAAGKPLAEHFPGLHIDLNFSDLESESLSAARADAWILALDNGQARRFVDLKGLAESRIIDISSDHRFDPKWVYGLTQKNETQIASSRRVANPGCYATAVQLGLLPVCEWLDDTPPVAFCVSGYSGAGRMPGPRNDAGRLRDNFLPYMLTGHGHEAEVSRHLGRELCLTPHVAGFFRGISVTISFQLRDARSLEQIVERFVQWYARWPLVEVVRDVPEISQVRESNRAIIGGFSMDARDSRRVVLVSVLDNLRKGAASQAVENLNLMFGFAPSTGLAL